MQMRRPRPGSFCKELSISITSCWEPSPTAALRILDCSHWTCSSGPGWQFRMRPHNGGLASILRRHTLPFQAALAYRIAGDPTRSAQLLAGLEAERTPSGFLNATREARVSTRLSLDPTGTGTEPDFFYFRRPHLGATAW